MTLLLQAVDIRGENNWRWVLSEEETGMLLADQLVALKPASSEYEGFADLPAYLQWRAVPDRRPKSESRLLSQLSDWLGSNLLGAVGPAIAANAPEAVWVALPAELTFLLDRPLGLARVDGVPLAAQASLVFGIPGDGDSRLRPKQPVAERLRMLAVFSMPTAVSAGSLRRERYHLSRLVRVLGTRRELAIDLRVLQYGVTRQRLQDLLDEGEGWDIIHLSGHGGAAGSGILLEHADGSPDVLMADSLTTMLRPCRSRLKLIVISNNQTPAIGTAERSRYLGFSELPAANYTDVSLPGASGLPLPWREGDQSALGTPLPGLALKLAERLECAVLAARYPLAEETTVLFNESFYSCLFERQRDVASAMSAALAEIGHASPGTAQLAAASPILIGPRAERLAILPPRGKAAAPDAADSRLPFFPDEPVRFVGRDSVMAQASAALAPESGHRGLLLHGLAGAGKTACAVELAYRHADAFEQAVWWHAPSEDGGTALASLAAALEEQLIGFQFSAGLRDDLSYQRHLRGLTALLEERAVLMVLDGLDTLVTSAGEWRDLRWNDLIRTLAEQQGISRVILTSRVPLSTSDGVLALPVHNLSLDETIQLAGELPNLHRLLHDDGDPAEAAAPAEADRELVLRVLRVVQGHPQLMELADAAAADPARLDVQLTEAEDAAAGQRLEAFFRDGASVLGPDEVVNALTAWTRSALAMLPAATRLMAEFVACLEDSDRRSDLVDIAWAPLWKRLARPGDAPAPRPLLAALVTAALADVDPGPAGQETYRVHSGVAAAIIELAGPETRTAVDDVMGSAWFAISRWAEEEGTENSGLLVHAGLAAAPYLMRSGEWDRACFLLEHAVRRDSSPATVQAALPSLRRIAAAVGTPEANGALARALVLVEPAEAERLLRTARDDSADNGDYRAAFALSSDLVQLLADTGRLAEAMDATARQTEFAELAGLEPWTRLAVECQRLEVLAQVGEHSRVLEEVRRLREVMAEMPSRSDSDEVAVAPWNVRERILDLGRFAAAATAQWELCLELNSEIAASERQRGASRHEIARTMYNDAGPLIRLARLSDAGQVLAECQRVFEDQADTSSLAVVLTSRADLEDKLGHQRAAADLERTALRLSYARPEPRRTAISHHNLALYMQRLGEDRTEQRAHRLAATLLFSLVGLGHELTKAIEVLASEQREDIDRAGLPATVAQVVAIAEQTEGVRLGALLGALEPDPGAVASALGAVLQAAAKLSPEDGQDAPGRAPQPAPSVDEQWLQVISAVVAAAEGSQEASSAVRDFLNQLSGTSDWGALVTVLRRILDGDRDPGRLTEGVRAMDAVDVDIVERVLSGVHGADSAQVRAWRASPIAENARRPMGEIII